MESFSRLQGPAKPLVADAQYQPGALQLAALRLNFEVAGIYQHGTVALAIIFAGFRSGQNGKGIVLMAAGAPVGTNRHDAVGHRGAFRHPLHAVPSLKMDHVPLTKGQIQAGRGCFVQPDGSVAAISQHSAAGDHVLFRENAVV